MPRVVRQFRFLEDGWPLGLELVRWPEVFEGDLTPAGAAARERLRARLAMASRSDGSFRLTLPAAGPVGSRPPSKRGVGVDIWAERPWLAAQGEGAALVAAEGPGGDCRVEWEAWGTIWLSGVWSRGLATLASTKTSTPPRARASLTDHGRAAWVEWAGPPSRVEGLAGATRLRTRRGVVWSALDRLAFLYDLIERPAAAASSPLTLSWSWELGNGVRAELVSDETGLATGARLTTRTNDATGDSPSDALVQLVGETAPQSAGVELRLLLQNDQSSTNLPARLEACLTLPVGRRRAVLPLMLSWNPTRHSRRRLAETRTLTVTRRSTLLGLDQARAERLRWGESVWLLDFDLHPTGSDLHAALGTPVASARLLGRMNRAGRIERVAALD
ncbi:hypothetical protein Isop_2644 [Isosphaera pallida ATCC 43644]|uniref:Uncharacterized protein n=1 Tax=Isosphaera pallida (strain ATCC 43644 / DSM 9630 / IS1B) TaxID=575540 RepID=E8QZS3_ISOPI|nr:hypothetical protein [Isosphaera pallida]ADV63214.1 hypothetical protein Isop_2644 [Isosphaera pallida ATCC 43644]